MLKNGIPGGHRGNDEQPDLRPNLAGLAAGIGAGAGQHLLNGKANGKQNGNAEQSSGQCVGRAFKPALAKGSSMSGKADFSVDEWDLLRSSTVDGEHAGGRCKSKWTGWVGAGIDAPRRK